MYLPATILIVGLVTSALLVRAGRREPAGRENREDAAPAIAGPAGAVGAHAEA